MNVTVKVDAAAVRKALDGLSEATSNRAIIRSLDRAVDAGRTEATRVVREELNLKLSDVKDAISVRKAGRAHLSGAIVIAPKPVPLIDYGAREARKGKVGSGGVSFKIKRSGGRGFLARAFIATMKSGHRGVFTRDEKGQGGRSPRLPIRELFSTSVRQLFKRESAVKRVTTRAAEAFMATAQNQIALALSRAKTGRGVDITSSGATKR